MLSQVDVSRVMSWLETDGHLADGKTDGHLADGNPGATSDTLLTDVRAEDVLEPVLPALLIVQVVDAQSPDDLTLRTQAVQHFFACERSRAVDAMLAELQRLVGVQTVVRTDALLDVNLGPLSAEARDVLQVCLRSALVFVLVLHTGVDGLAVLANVRAPFPPAGPAFHLREAADC